MNQKEHQPTADRPGNPECAQEATFGEALHEALKARGLSLQRLHHHLGARGISVSPVTLSHWQRGRSQPERRQSLRAVAEIEVILNLAPGTLQTLLTHRRPRGKALAPTSHMPDALSRVLGPGAPLERALGADAYRFNEDLVSLSVQETVRLDEHGCIDRYSVSHVVRALNDGVRRVTAHHHLDDPDTPSVQVTVNCGSLEALRFRQEVSSAIFDIGFGRPLRRGETAIIDYTLDIGPRWKPSNHHERTLPVPVRQYLLHIFFHPRHVPSAVYGYYGHNSEAGPEEIRPLSLDASHSVHILPAKCHAGIYAWKRHADTGPGDPPDRPPQHPAD
ncbi:helix-turn-helix transcriptional regulator [Streptomyces sp. NPDC047028]|uniref:helix-turn-helix domain-containing protein n=1 Tax=Streptomyces sp. NPDC047028 TaxID=3155793 RepID=UPI0033CA357F